MSFFSKTLIDLREKKGLSVTETAENLLMLVTVYSGYESGVSEPDSTALSHIAKYYRVPVAWIINTAAMNYTKSDTTVKLYNGDSIFPTPKNKQNPKVSETVYQALSRVDKFGDESISINDRFAISEICNAYLRATKMSHDLVKKTVKQTKKAETLSQALLHVTAFNGKNISDLDRQTMKKLGAAYLNSKGTNSSEKKTNTEYHESDLTLAQALSLVSSVDGKQISDYDRKLMTKLFETYVNTRK